MKYLSRRSFVGKLTNLVYLICLPKLATEELFAQTGDVEQQDDHCVLKGEGWDRCKLSDPGQVCSALGPSTTDDYRLKGHWFGCCMYCESPDHTVKKYKCCKYTDICSNVKQVGWGSPAFWCGTGEFRWYVCTTITCTGDYDSHLCGGVEGHCYGGSLNGE